jgi:hypothetical protein
MQAIRLTGRDNAELVAYLTPFFDKKRGMFPKGRIPAVSLDSEPIGALPKVIVRVIDRANGKNAHTTPAKMSAVKLKGNTKTIMSRPLIDLGLRVALFNLLTKLKIKTIGGLFTWVSTREDELRITPLFGRGSLKECREKLEANGLKLD